MGRNSSFLSVGLTALIMSIMLLSTIHVISSGSIRETDIIIDESVVSGEENFGFTATGNIYYVDATGGNDSKSGLSTTSAWKTVARVASKTLQPGDIVRFKRGEVFKITTAIGFLKLYEDGSANGWITIETYGTGAKPIIDGQDIPDYCIYVRGDYYIIRDLEVINSGNQAVLISASYVLLENLDVHESGNCGIIHYGGGSHFTVKNCTTYNITNTGIALMGSTYNKLKDTLIENCTTYDCGNDGISIHKTGGGATAGANHTIRNCIGYNNPEEAIDVQTGLNVTVENCIGYNNSRGSFVLSPDIDCVVRNNLFYGGGGGYEFAIVGTTGLKMYNNIIINGQSDGKTKLLLISDENGPADNIEIYDNILIDTGGGKWSERLIWVDDMNNDGNLGSISIKNNIMISHRPFYYFRNKAASSSDIDIDGNCYYHLTSSFSYAGYNFSQWQSNYGYDKNGMEANPLLVNYNSTKVSDFMLKANSPCIDKGVKTNVTDDFLSTLIYAKNDIGAMEYKPPYVLGEDKIGKTAKIEVYGDGRYLYLSGAPETNGADLSLKPSAGWKASSPVTSKMEISVKAWNLTGDTYRKWTEISADPLGNMTYRIGDMLSNGNYIITVDSSSSFIRKADSTGYLEFNIDTTSKSRMIDIRLGSGSLFSSDKSTESATTGDPFTLSIEALDNKGISTVCVEYWFGSSSVHTNKTMQRVSGSSLVGQYSYGITIASDKTEDISYKFSAKNTVGKWINTALFKHPVVDNDLPVILEDKTPSTINTGNDLVFDFSFSDNIGIKSAILTYWDDDNYTVNVDLKAVDGYSYELSVSEDHSGDLRYFVNVTDASSLWNCSGIKLVKVVDNLLHEITFFKIEGEPTTGEDIRMSLRVDENSDVSSVSIEYWFGSGVHTNQKMTGPDYNITISIPGSSLSSLNYRISITDSSSIKRTSGLNVLDTIDNDIPVLIADQSDSTVEPGGDYLIALKLSDNIGIAEAVIDYRFGEDHTIVKMSISNGVYRTTVKIPSDTVYNLEYEVKVTDTSGNYLTISDNTVYLFDDILPTFIGDLSQTTATTGDSFTFKISVTDNVGIANVYVEYSFGKSGITNVTMTGSETTIILPEKDNKDLIYSFHVVDRSGNWNSTIDKTVDIKDNDPPVIHPNSGKKPVKTRGYLHFTANVTDNVMVDEVLTEYWFSDGQHYFIQMEFDGTNYTGFIEMTDSDLSLMNYRFIARDGSNNEAVSEIITIDDQFFDDMIFVEDGPSSGFDDFNVAIEISSPHDKGIVGYDLLFRSVLTGTGSITRIGLYIDGNLYHIVEDDFIVSSDQPYEYEHYIDTRDFINGDHTMELRIVPLDRENIFIAERVSVQIFNVDYDQMLTDINLNINDVIAIAGDSVRFQVHCYDQFGSLIPYNKLVIVWQAAGPIGQVDETGLFTAEYPGKVKVTVSVQYGGRTLMDAANVTVYPANSIGGSSGNDAPGIISGFTVQSMVIVIMVVMMVVIIVLSGYIIKNRSRNDGDETIPVVVMEAPPEQYPIQEVVEPVLREAPVYSAPQPQPVVSAPVETDPVFDLPPGPSMEDDIYDEEDFGEEFNEIYMNDYVVSDSEPYNPEDDLEVKELMDLLDDLSDDPF